MRGTPLSDSGCSLLGSSPLPPTETSSEFSSLTEVISKSSFCGLLSSVDEAPSVTGDSGASAHAVEGVVTGEPEDIESSFEAIEMKARILGVCGWSPKTTLGCLASFLVFHQASASRPWLALPQSREIFEGFYEYFPQKI